MLLYGDFLLLQEFRDSVEHMKKKLSVIIPVYNQLEYFKKCLDSVVNQTYSNLEIICVDDGSRDGAQDYLDEVASKDSRVIAIHQKNSGESHARNVGLMQATGDYITFVDCDDWIEGDMYETLVSTMECEDVDMVASGWFKEEEGNTTEIKNEESVAQGVFGTEQLLRYIYMRDSYRGFAYMWNKIYKKEIMMHQGKIQLFDENLKLGGDVIYLAKMALNSKSCIYIDKAFYHYRIRRGSGSHSKSTELIRDWIKSYELTINALASNKVSEEIIDYVKRFMAYHAMEGAIVALELKEEKAFEYFKKVMMENEKIYVRLNQNHPERIREYKSVINEGKV